MRQMADAETDGAGDQVGQIADDGDQIIGGAALEDQLVGGVMDDDIEAVIGESADAIGGQQRRPPVVQAQAAHDDGKADLQADDSQA